MNDFMEQAPVTNWPLRIVLVGVVIAVIALVCWAMWRGWRQRGRRQADIPAPPAAPDLSSVDTVTGMFLGTSRAGDWLDRIVVHGLGVPSRAECAVLSGGIAFERSGARSFFIPRADLQGVHLDRGIAGVVRERDSVIVLTWQLGPASLACGFRPDDGEQSAALLDSCMALVTQ